MKLFEINEQNELGHDIRTDLIKPYKKSLMVLWGKDAILAVTSVFNACSYAQIVPADEFTEWLDEYVNNIPGLNDEEKEAEKELINYQSIPLHKF